MKKTILVLLLGLLFFLNGCTKNKTLLNVVYDVNMSDLSEEDMLLVDEGIYSDSFVFSNVDDISNWIDNHDNADSLLIDDLNEYSSSFFDESFVVVVYITRRAYSFDFCLKSQELVNNTLYLEVQYYIPWYAFGDSWPQVYALIIELPKGTIDNLLVDVAYVER